MGNQALGFVPKRWCEFVESQFRPRGKSLVAPIEVILEASPLRVLLNQSAYPIQFLLDLFLVE